MAILTFDGPVEMTCMHKWPTLRHKIARERFWDSQNKIMSKLKKDCFR